MMAQGGKPTFMSRSRSCSCWVHCRRWLMRSPALSQRSSSASNSFSRESETLYKTFAPSCSRLSHTRAAVCKKLHAKNYMLLHPGYELDCPQEDKKKGKLEVRNESVHAYALCTCNHRSAILVCWQA